MKVLKTHHVNCNQHFKDLCESFHSFSNTDIVSQGNEKISTSSVLVRVCCQVLHDLIKDILSARELHLDDKMVVILPDFSSDTIHRFIEYLLGRSVTFKSASEQEEVLQLLRILSFDNKVEEELDVTDIDNFAEVLLEEADIKSEPSEVQSEGSAKSNKSTNLVNSRNKYKRKAKLISKDEIVNRYSIWHHMLNPC